jgi:hypothetical protein
VSIALVAGLHQDRTQPLPQKEASMYFIVEIQLGGTETFLEGSEASSEAWNVASRLQCVARRRRKKVRYEVR